MKIVNDAAAQSWEIHHTIKPIEEIFAVRCAAIWPGPFNGRRIIAWAWARQGEKQFRYVPIVLDEYNVPVPLDLDDQEIVGVFGSSPSFSDVKCKKHSYDKRRTPPRSA